MLGHKISKERCKKCIWFTKALNYCPFPQCAYDRLVGRQDEAAAVAESDEPADEKAKASREWIQSQVELEVRKILEGRRKIENGEE